jgi:glycogen(starch) synthase
MRILMLVATSVATDTRVLREAGTLVAAGNEVHIIGKSVPADFVPAQGFTVSSVGSSSVFQKEDAPSLSSRKMGPLLTFTRWMLLPQHRNSAFGRWASGAVTDGRVREYDVVHAHDFTALRAGAELARLRDVPLVYDSHELWSGRPRMHRPTPVQSWRERREEAALGGEAVAVITVGDGVAEALRQQYGWTHLHVIRNTFPAAAGGPPPAPVGAVYAGRLAPHRELETIARAAGQLPVPVTLIGPADQTWLRGYDAGGARVRESITAEAVTTLLQQTGIALVTHTDAFANLRLAMPNKLFQAVAAGVPVVATDVGELAALVREHHVGVLYRMGDAPDLVRAVGELIRDYDVWCSRVAKAQETLSWDGDAARLVQLYRALAGEGQTVA